MAISSHSTLLPSLSPWKPFFCFLTLNLPILNISYNWNQIIYGPCAWLLALSIMFLWIVHNYSMYVYFLPFDGQIIFHHVDIHHILCIRSSVGGHTWVSVFFCLLWIMVDIHVQVLSGHVYSVFLCIYLRVELLSYLVTLCNILRTCQTSFQSGCTSL